MKWHPDPICCKLLKDLYLFRLWHLSFLGFQCYCERLALLPTCSEDSRIHHWERPLQQKSSLQTQRSQSHLYCLENQAYSASEFDFKLISELIINTVVDFQATFQRLDAGGQSTLSFDARQLLHIELEIVYWQVFSGILPGAQGEELMRAHHLQNWGQIVGVEAKSDCYQKLFQISGLERWIVLGFILISSFYSYSYLISLLFASCFLHFLSNRSFATQLGLTASWASRLSRFFRAPFVQILFWTSQ